MSLFLVNQILDRPDPFKPLSHTKFLPLLACTLQLQLQYQEIQFINYTHSCHDFSNYHVFPFLLPLLLFSNRFLLPQNLCTSHPQAMVPFLRKPVMQSPPDLQLLLISLPECFFIPHWLPLFMTKTTTSLFCLIPDRLRLNNIDNLKKKIKPFLILFNSH